MSKFDKKVRNRKTGEIRIVRFSPLKNSSTVFALPKYDFEITGQMGGSEMTKVEVTEDFGNMMISAIRYGLWRRTYITVMTSDYIIPLVKQGAFSERVLVVMDRDLTQYEEDRAYRLQSTEKNKWALDDDCDYAAWSALHKVICEKLIEMRGKNG